MISLPSRSVTKMRLRTWTADTNAGALGHESPGDNSPTLRVVRVSICIGAVDATPPGWQAAGCTRLWLLLPLILGTHTHTRTKDHLGQISPVDARGVRGRVTRGMLNISSHLFFFFSPPSSSDAAARESVCASMGGVWGVE